MCAWEDEPARESANSCRHALRCVGEKYLSRLPSQASTRTVWKFGLESEWEKRAFYLQLSVGGAELKFPADGEIMRPVKRLKRDILFLAIKSKAMVWRLLVSPGEGGGEDA